MSHYQDDDPSGDEDPGADSDNSDAGALPPPPASLRPLPASLQRFGPGHLARIAPRWVLARGARYFRRGLVREIRWDEQKLAAVVKGSADEPYKVELDIADPAAIHLIQCSCPFFREGRGVCKHAVAAIHQALHEGGRPILRGGGRSRSAAPAPGASPAASDAARFARPPRGFAGGRPLPRTVMAFFRGFLRDPRAEVDADLDERGECVVVRMRERRTERSVALVFPARETSLAMGALRALHGVRFSERLSSLEVSKDPIIPGARAEFDAAGRLVLTPGYKRPDGGWIPFHEVAVAPGGTQPHFDGYRFYPVAVVSRFLRSFVGPHGRRVLEGEEIPRFILGELPGLLREAGFSASSRVVNARVWPPPKVAAMEASVADAETFWIDPLYEIMGHRFNLPELLSLGRPGFLRSKDDWIAVTPQDLFREWEEFGGRVEGGRVRIPRLYYLRLRAEQGDRVPVRAAEQVRAMEDALTNAAATRPVDEPSGMKGELRPYQRAGYAWLSFLRKAGLSGILADEMGLGKTHQAMALLLEAHANGTKRPSLVVCPASVIDHWETKLKAHAPGLSPVRFHGWGRTLPSGDGGKSIVLTTYGIVTRDAALLSEVPWECVILDEAQRIKNANTKMAKAVKMLKPAFRCALTGTPIENRLAEFWSIFDFLLPGYFGTLKSFRDRFESPIMKNQDVEAANTLKRLVRPFKLRRLKKDVLQDLPPKVEDIRSCNLTRAQAIAYRTVLEGEAASVLDGLRDDRRPIDYLHVFAILTRLKRMCDHPVLVLGAKGQKAGSGKFELFKEILEEALDSGEKVVVFSQYLEMMDLIENHLDALHVRYSELRGSTRDRGAAIRRFQEDPDCRVFVASLLAGGLGIDLTAGAVVIHYDRWWNPAREDQATDRVHRIGQTRGVQVFKLISRGTVEERIDRLIGEKRVVSEAILDSDAAGLKAFSRAEMLSLFTLPPIPDEEAEAESAAETEAVEEAGGAEEKPARRRRTRKAAAEAPETLSVEAEKKPRRRGRPPKAAAPVEPAVLRRRRAAKA
ncbi:MAG: DEAD/DEAH box helicase [Planctomycetota bacterium]